jgi:hypothetical protein
MAVRNTHTVAAYANHPLDETLARIARIPEHDNVTAVDALPAIHQFVDEDAFLVFQTRFHTAAFHLHRLINKQDDEE